MRRPFPLPSDIPGKVRPRHEVLRRQARLAIGTARVAELKRSHNAAVLQRAREVSARAQEQRRLRRVAALAANKAILAVRRAYFQMDKIDAPEFERATWNARKELVLDELRKIAEGRRP
jgi:hypothetical protein